MLKNRESFNSELPSFPNPVGAQGVVKCTLGNEGLTKRELLAAMAMQGLLASPQTGSRSYSYLALKAVRQADALLTALDAPYHEIHEDPDDA